MISLGRIIFAIVLTIGIAAPIVAATFAGIVGLGLCFLPHPRRSEREVEIPAEWLDRLASSALKI